MSFIRKIFKAKDKNLFTKAASCSLLFIFKNKQEHEHKEDGKVNVGDIFYRVDDFRVFNGAYKITNKDGKTILLPDDSDTYEYIVRKYRVAKFTYPLCDSAYTRECDKISISLLHVSEASNNDYKFYPENDPQIFLERFFTELNGKNLVEPNTETPWITYDIVNRLRCKNTFFRNYKDAVEFANKLNDGYSTFLKFYQKDVIIDRKLKNDNP